MSYFRYSDDIRYLARSTATYRSVQSRLRDAVSLKDFTGATDDIIFQKALDQLTVDGGGTLYVPPGNYSEFADSVIVPSNVTIYGYGATLTCSTVTDGATISIFKNVTDNIHNVNLFGLKFVGPGSSIPVDRNLNAGVAITGITKANPAVITTGAAHGLNVNSMVMINGVLGMTEINGTYKVETVPSTTTYTLRSVNNAIVNSTGYGTYTSGGFSYRIADPAYGLLSFVNSGGGQLDSINYYDLDLSACYTGIITAGATRITGYNTKIHDYMVYAAVTARTADYTWAFNRSWDCAMKTSYNSYGFTATGDTTGGEPQEGSLVIGNIWRDNVSWDGMMIHDCVDVRVIGNAAINCRTGYDLGNNLGTTRLKRFIIADNYHEGYTGSDTWNGTAATGGGYLCISSGANLESEAIVLTNNITIGAGAISGANYGPSGSGAFSLLHAYDVAMNGNIARDVAVVPGLFLGGTLKNLKGEGNIIRGSMASGGIYGTTIASNATIDLGMRIEQTTASDTAISLVNSSLGYVDFRRISSNSTSFLTESSVTYTDLLLTYLRQSAFTTTGAGQSLNMAGKSWLYINCASASTITSLTNVIVGRVYYITFANTNCSFSSACVVTPAAGALTPTHSDVTYLALGRSTTTLYIITAPPE